MNAEDFIALVTPNDIRNAAYGAKIPSGSVVDEQIQLLIGKAVRELLSVVPLTKIQNRIDSSRITLNDVKDVIENMVVRVAKNPSGYRQFGIDDFQATIDSAISTGQLYVSDDERRRLVGPRARNFGSIKVAVPNWRMPRGRR